MGTADRHLGDTPRPRREGVSVAQKLRQVIPYVANPASKLRHVFELGEHVGDSGTIVEGMEPSSEVGQRLDRSSLHRNIVTRPRKIDAERLDPDGVLGPERSAEHRVADLG